MYNVYETGRQPQVKLYPIESVRYKFNTMKHKAHNLFGLELHTQKSESRLETRHMNILEQLQRYKYSTTATHSERIKSRKFAKN